MTTAFSPSRLAQAVGASLLMALVAGCQQTASVPPATIMAPPAAVRPELSGLINPVGPFAVEVWSGMAPQPRIGDRLRLSIRPSIDGYLSLFNVSSSGGTARLLDNVHVRAGRSVVYPSDSGSFDIALVPPVGVESFVAVVSRDRLDVPLSGVVRGGRRVTELQLSSMELADRIHAATSYLPTIDWNVAVLDINTQY